MVLTLDALDYPEEVWNFFVSNGILSFGFNVEEIEGANLRSSLDHLQAARKYQAFFRRLLELREGYNRRVRIREIDDAVNKLMNASGEVGSSENSPLSIVSFDYEGNLSTYSPELLTSVHPKYGLFVFGNVKQLESLEEILSNRKLMSINSEIQAG